ncbi:MAG: hypothetical protein ACJ763_02550 [Bdellovibrionia bacterium]
MNKQTIISKVGVLMAAVFATAAVTACNSQGNAGNPVIDGVQGPNVSLVNGTLTISAVLTNVIFQGGVTMQIPHTQSSYIEVSPNLAGQGMLLQLGLSMNDLSFLDGNANTLPANQLPGGRPIPGIIGGALPSVAVQVPQWDNATFYIGSAFVGVFIPVKFGAQGVTGTFLFFDQNNKQIGTISIVGADNDGKNSGLLLMLNLKTIMPTYTAATSQSSLM